MTVTRRVAAVALAVFVAGTSAACAQRGQQLGGGEDVDVCAGWREFDGLDEPSLDDRAAVVRWVEGELRILDRIDLRRDVDGDPVPSEVRGRLRAVEEALRGFRSAARSASGGDELRDAAEALARSDFADAASEITDFAATSC